MRKVRSAFTVLLAAVSLLCSGASPVAGDAGPANVARVSAGIYRSPQPRLDSLPAIAALGIRTVVSLRSEDSNEAERSAAREAGLRFISIELPGFGRPDDASISRVLRAITAASNQPVLVHCHRGADRTGVVVACYRIGYEGWSAEEALAEAKAHGLGWWQAGMRKYIRGACGHALADIGSLDGD